MTPFEAIAEPNRRRLLELIGTGETSAGDLVDRSGFSQPGVSKHLRHLREAGVVRVRADGQRRLYSVDVAKLALLSSWLQQFWAVRLDALDAHLEKEQ
jgi:DNA-binding transcriptional ArsR family regulator